MQSNSPQSKTGSAAVPWEKVPAKGWITVLAGISINLCLGVLVRLDSVWKAALLANKNQLTARNWAGVAYSSHP